VWIAFLLVFINNDTNKSYASFHLLNDNVNRKSIRDASPFTQTSRSLWLWYSPISNMFRHWGYLTNFYQEPNSREAPFYVSQILHEIKDFVKFWDLHISVGQQLGIANNLFSMFPNVYSYENWKRRKEGLVRGLLERFLFEKIL
jgi:hypothetical protein